MVHRAWPAGVEFGGPFVELSAGFEYTCGVRPTGELSCWGRNDDLQVLGGWFGTSGARRA